MTEVDVPAQLRLAQGEERQFVLPSHGGGGYRWHAHVDGADVRATIDYEDPFPTEDSPGPIRSIAQILTISAVRSGSATVHLQERRSWEVDAADTRRIDVQVDQ